MNDMKRAQKWIDFQFQFTVAASLNTNTLLFNSSLFYLGNIGQMRENHKESQR